MDLPPFPLNDWLERHQNIQFDLAGSCGPRWTVAELELLGTDELDIRGISIDYCPIEGSFPLRAEIAALYCVDPDWVTVTQGATEALLLVMQALSRPNGNVLLPSPVYNGFAGACAATQLQPRYYPHPHSPIAEADLEDIAALVDDETVLVIMNTPHNPTGASLGQDDRIALNRKLGDKGVPLAIDAVYDPLGFGDVAQSSAGIRDMIIVGSMSKLLSLPGLRIGWVIDADERRRARIVRARGYTSLGGSPIVETLATHALRNRVPILRRVAGIAGNNLHELRHFMDAVDDILDWIPPRTGMLAFPRFRDGSDSRIFCEGLASKGVLIAPGECFGLPAHMRIGFGSQPDGIRPALAIVEQELRERSSSIIPEQ